MDKVPSPKQRKIKGHTPQTVSNNVRYEQMPRNHYAFGPIKLPLF